jgi:hypothetical protein
MLSCIFEGAFGINGPPLVVYGDMRQWNAKHFRATLQAYFLPASLVGLGGYALKGLINQEVLKYFLISQPAVVAAVLSAVI